MTKYMIYFVKDIKELLVCMREGLYSENCIPCLECNRDQIVYLLKVYSLRCLFIDKPVKEDFKNTIFKDINRSQAILCNKNANNKEIVLWYSQMTGKEIIYFDCTHKKYCDAKSKLVIEEYKNITNEMLLNLSDFWNNEGDNEKHYWGIIPYEKLEDLYFILLKNLLFMNYEGGTTYALMKAIDEPIDIKSDDYAITTRYTSKYEDFVKYVTSDTKLLSIYNHGRDDSVYISQGMLCANGEKSICIESNGKYPMCAYGEGCIREDRENYKVQSVNSLVVFINSCFSMRLIEGTFHLDYTLAKAFAKNNACVYIGFPMMKAGREFENILFQKLMLNGFSVGKAISYVNRILYRNKLELPWNIVVGDPDFCFKRDERYEMKVYEAKFEGGQDIYSIDIAGENLSLVDICIEDRELIKLLESKSYSLHLKEINKKDLFIYYFPLKGRQYHIYICKWGFLDSFKLSLFKEEDSIDNLFKNRIGVEIDNLKMLKYQIKNYKNIESKVVDLENNAYNIMRMIDTMKYNIMDNQSGWYKTKKLINKIDQINRIVSNMLVEETKNRIYHFPESIKYMNTFLNARKCEEKCPLCGDIIFEETTENTIHKYYKRISHICPNCGVVTDMPNSNLRIKIVGEKHIKKGVEYNYSIIMTVKNLIEKIGYLSLVLVDGEKDGFIIENQEQCILVKQNEEIAVDYVLKVPQSVKSHHYWLRSYFVSAGEIYYFGDNIWVGN